MGLKRGEHNGVLGHYNIRADPDLGLGVVALCHVPCACSGCLEQLSIHWENNVNIKDQPRYASSSSRCKFWPLFHGLNDWKVVRLLRTSEDDDKDDEKAMALEGIATRMAEEVVPGRYGAFLMDDEDAGGFYIVKWTTTAYTLQEDIMVQEYDPPIKLQSRELVACGEYLNKVPRANLWYVPPPQEMRTTVRMQQVVLANCTMHPVSELNRIPHNVRTHSFGQNALKLDLVQYESMLEESTWRKKMDHNEWCDIEEESDVDDD